MKGIAELDLYVLTGHITDPSWLGTPEDQTARPLYINRDNTNGGRARSLAEAWSDGRAFAVRMRPEILPVDLDADIVHLSHEVRLLAGNHPCLEVASSGLHAPSRHFYILLRDEEVREQVASDLAALVGSGALRRGQPIRPPGAPHRFRRERAVPVDEHEFRQFCRAVLPDTSEILGWLQPSTLRFAATRANDRSAHDHAVIRRLIAEGLSDGEIILLALGGNLAFSEKARELPSGIRLTYLQRSLRKLRPTVFSRDQFRTRQDVDSFLERCEEAVSLIDPAEFGGHTARRVFTAAVSLFRDQHTLSRPLAVRTVAEHAQVSVQTAARQLGVLVTTGWLAKREGASGGKAVTYGLETSKISTHLRALGGCATRSVLIQAGTDEPLFRRGILNESGRSVWNALDDSTALSPTQVSARTRIPVSTVQKALKRLLGVGLVERPVRGRYVRSNEHDLEVLAEQTGADVRAKQQRALYDRERAGFGGHRLRRLSQLYGSEILFEWEPVDSYRVRRLRDGTVVTIDELREDLRRPTPMCLPVGQSKVQTLR